MSLAADGDFDVLGLLAAADAHEVRFGMTDVRSAMSGGTFSEALSKLPKAELRLRSRLTRGLLIDYLAPVSAQYGTAKRFVGDVVTARPDRDVIHVDLSSMPELEESTTSALATWGVPHYEVMHVLTRSAGLSDDQLNIEGLDTLPHELFEVVVPVEGISLGESMTLGGCRLVPAGVITQRLRDLTQDANLIGPFDRAPCAAVALAAGARMLGAEAAGLAQIDHALAWIAVSLRYGLTHWPHGSPQRFERTAFQAVPQRIDLVWLRALSTGRQLIRETGPAGSRPRLDLQPEHLLGEPPTGFSVQDRQAIEALRRAGATGDPIQAITALWDAIEFYVAGTPGPGLFSDAQLKALRKAVPGELPPPLRARAIESINRLNQSPLLARLRAAVEADGVPSADDEWALLQQLRRSRNALVHGAGAHAVPSSRDIARSIAFVARLLVHRAYRVSGS